MNVATVGIRQAAWDGLRDNQRAVMRWAVARLALGIPARYTDGTDEWFVFDDWRVNLDQIAILGALVVALSGLPVGWEPTLNPDGTVDRATTETRVIGYVSPTVIWPADITYDEFDPNPWQTTLDAQGAPDAIRAAGRVPDAFTPVDVS